jgi:hypothetical protein
MLTVNGKIFKHTKAITSEKKLMINLDSALIELLVSVIVNIIFISPFLWLSGRILVGKQKAKFTDALWIVTLGTVVSTVFGYFFEGIIASLIMLVIILSLVKHFFDCGWLKALVISIIAAVLFVLVTVILSIIGVGIGVALFKL